LTGKLKTDKNPDSIYAGTV